MNFGQLVGARSQRWKKIEWPPDWPVTRRLACGDLTIHRRLRPPIATARRLADGAEGLLPFLSLPLPLACSCSIHSITFATLKRARIVHAIEQSSFKRFCWLTVEEILWQRIPHRRHQRLSPCPSSLSAPLFPFDNCLFIFRSSWST